MVLKTYVFLVLLTCTCPIYSMETEIKQKNKEQFIERQCVACPVCEKLVRPPSLSCHMNIHTGAKPFLCIKCNTAYRWSEQARQCRCESTEISSISDPEQTDSENIIPKQMNPVTCAIIAQSFYAKPTLALEVKTVKKRVGNVTCTECKKLIPAFRFDRHMRSHTKPFKCTCGRGFAYSCDMKRCPCKILPDGNTALQLSSVKTKRKRSTSDDNEFPHDITPITKKPCIQTSLQRTSVIKKEELPLSESSKDSLRIKIITCSVCFTLCTEKNINQHMDSHPKCSCGKRILNEEMLSECMCKTKSSLTIDIDEKTITQSVFMVPESPLNLQDLDMAASMPQIEHLSPSNYMHQFLPHLVSAMDVDTIIQQLPAQLQLLKELHQS